MGIMRIVISIIGLGIIVLAFGIVFFLQGHSIVGPTSSFMYSNSQWITNGQIIAIVGGAILIAGIVISRLQHQAL